MSGESAPGEQQESSSISGAAPSRFDVIATVPSIFDGFRTGSTIGRAQESGVMALEIHDLRNWAHDRHRTIDDRPFGGGAGMVLKPEPLFAAIEAVRNPENSRLVVMSPRGPRFTQGKAQELATWMAGSSLPVAEAMANGSVPAETSPRPVRQLVLICGRYEGIDERVLDHFHPEPISIGDYVICGGEVAAMVVIEGVARLLPGFVGNEESLGEESFAEGTLEYPHFTRPAEFRGRRVPDVLLSGDHAAIRAWREAKKGVSR